MSKPDPTDRRPPSARPPSEPPPAEPPTADPALRGSAEVAMVRVEGGRPAADRDRLVTEEPLEVRLTAGGAEQTVAVTMRTPGADEELALGFLFAEGVISAAAEVRGTRMLEDPWGHGDRPSNVLQVELAADRLPELAGLDRHFFASSSCGVCGKAGIEAISLAGCRPAAGDRPRLDPALLVELPDRLRVAQGLFATTGGLHAAGLFDAAGELLAVREDVGRHNALDKLVGWALSEGLVPLSEHIVVLSGRSSFELVQKSVMAGVPAICSVSAPSSLAVELARHFGRTLIGFLRRGRFNVYAGGRRIDGGGFEVEGEGERR